jgi:hypothetical protein
MNLAAPVLDHQWLVAAFSRDALREVRPDGCPANRQETVVEAPTGTIAIWHGSSSRIEETPEFFAIAVGDVTEPLAVAKWLRTPPKRHAALLAIEKVTGLIWVVTDRLNLAKLFVLEAQGPRLICTHLAFLDPARRPLSVAGIASTLANGAALCNLTPYRDVRVLERASVHILRDDRIESTPYWQYGFAQTTRSSAGRRALKDAVVESIRADAEDRRILLSLSGGYDSAAILAVLAKHVSPREIRTFSYVLGDVLPCCDAAVARQMAELVGSPHEVVQSYGGSLREVVTRNGALGQGVANFCDEVDAWHQLSTEHSGATVIAGDECFGWIDRRLTSTQDVLLAVSVRDFRSAETLWPFLDLAVREAMEAELAAAVESVARRAASPNAHDQKDFLYLDVRLQSVLLAWRRFIAGAFFDVREPFLATDVLDVISTLTTHDRRGKRLYRSVARELAPEIFAVPRSTVGGYAPSWRHEIERVRDQLPAWTSVPSRLDDLVPPDAIVALASRVSSTAAPHSGLKQRIRKHVGSRAAEWIRPWTRPEFPRVSETDTLVLRALTLRQFLEVGGA